VAVAVTVPTSGRAQQGRRVLDEALRLLDLVQAQDGEAHRGGECRICPVCRGLALLREANPEAVARMTTAVVDLAAALGDFLAGPGRPASGPAPATGRDPAAEGDDAPPPPPAMLRIDITD